MERTKALNERALLALPPAAFSFPVLSLLTEPSPVSSAVGRSGTSATCSAPGARGHPVQEQPLETWGCTEGGVSCREDSSNPYLAHLRGVAQLLGLGSNPCDPREGFRSPPVTEAFRTGSHKISGVSWGPSHPLRHNSCRRALRAWIITTPCSSGPSSSSSAYLPPPGSPALQAHTHSVTNHNTKPPMHSQVHTLRSVGLEQWPGDSPSGPCPQSHSQMWAPLAFLPPACPIGPGKSKAAPEQPRGANTPGLCFLGSHLEWGCLDLPSTLAPPGWKPPAPACLPPSPETGVVLPFLHPG